MEENQENITLRIPVRIPYKVVQDYLRRQFIGEVIKKEGKEGEDKEYAEILSLSLDKSPRENFNLMLHLQIRTLTSFFKNKIIRIKMHAALQFNEVDQEIYVKDFSIEGENNSWLMNQFLELLANSVMYSSFRKKMHFSFQELLQVRKNNLNLKLENQLEAYSGILLDGYINQFKINDVIAGEDFLVLSVWGSGNIIVDIENTSFL